MGIEREKGGNGGEEPQIWVELGRYAGFGMTLALATGLFLLVGWWVDRWVGTTPLFTVSGALLGAAAGFYHMYQHLVLIPRRRGESRGSGKGDGPA